MIYGERLRLRFVEDDDEAFILSLRNAREFKEYYYSEDPISHSMHINFMNKVRACGDKYFIIERIEDNAAIGTIGLCNVDNVNRKCEYRWLMLDQKFRGHKYGDEAEVLIMKYAFETLNMHKVYGEVLVSNDRVIKMHEKNGFRIAGTFREHIYKHGKYQDVVWLEILKSEYLEKYGK